MSSPSKLTVRLDSTLIKRAKGYARERGTSLSQMIADYFRAITAGGTQAEPDWKQNLPPTTRSLIDVAPGSKIDEADYRRHLEERHR